MTTRLELQTSRPGNRQSGAINTRLRFPGGAIYTHRAAWRAGGRSAAPPTTNRAHSAMELNEWQEAPIHISPLH